MSISQVSMNQVQTFKSTSQPVAFGADSKTMESSDSYAKNDKGNTAKKVLIGAGIVAATVGTAAGLVLLAKKGKLGDGAKEFVNKIFKPKNIENVAQTIDDLPKTLKDVDFKCVYSGKKVATIKTTTGDSLFNGTIEDTLKSGKKVKLTYKDGLIKESILDDKLFKRYIHDATGADKSTLVSTVKTFNAEGNVEKIAETIRPNPFSSGTRYKLVTNFDGPEATMQYLSKQKQYILPESYFAKPINN